MLFESSRGRPCVGNVLPRSAMTSWAVSTLLHAVAMYSIISCGMCIVPILRRRHAFSSRQWWRAVFSELEIQHKSSFSASAPPAEIGEKQQASFSAVFESVQRAVQHGRIAAQPAQSSAAHLWPVSPERPAEEAEKAAPRQERRIRGRGCKKGEAAGEWTELAVCTNL